MTAAPTPAPTTPAAEQDPLAWCIGITLAFAALVWWRLGIPSKIYFDEVHYVSAARKLLQLIPANAEHPLVGKEAIAAAIALWGDKPMVWRIPSALMGCIGLYAFTRAIWFASGRAFATQAASVLLFTDFSWFVQSRIAMLDMVMAGFGMIGLWQVAAAVRQSNSCAFGGGERLGLIRARLALAGISFGLAMGAKWSVLPAVALVGMGFIALRVRAAGRASLAATNAPPLPGISLAEGMFWLGSVPLAVYCLTFLPIMFYHRGAVSLLDLAQYHHEMVRLQASVVTHHPYQSVWWQWIVNWRAIWYLYEVVDGGQRGILLVGNPVSMLAGLPAFGWCLWVGLKHQRADALACALLYALCLGLWAVNGKPVQFYYHYLLPGAFLMGCLALALDALSRLESRWRWAGPAGLVLAVALFGIFFPIIAAVKLEEGSGAFEAWMWLRGWR